VGLTDDIDGGPVGLDTAVFIYFIEEHPDFLPCLACVSWTSIVTADPDRGEASG
jgi:hypothetical protein